jgi:ribosomal-protein-alanine N-acetyltransferase
LSGRVVLRPPGPEHERVFLERVAASRRLHRPWVAPPADAAAFRRYVERSRDADYRALLSFRRADAALVGVANLSVITRGPLQSAYLGFYGFVPFDGQGYMEETVRGALRVAFGRLRLHRVEANVQPGNRRSLALVARCGFRREGFSPRYLKIGGRWRDHERWAILSDEDKLTSR